MSIFPQFSLVKNRQLGIAEITLSEESLATKIFWILYFPVGSVLAIFRILGLTLAFGIIRVCRIRSSALTNALVNFFLGLRISYNLPYDELQQHFAGRILAANHISVYDLFVGLNLPRIAVLFSKPDGHLINRLILAVVTNMHGITWDAGHLRERVRNFNAWAEDPESLSLCVVPEKTISNGKGLFAFDPVFFAKGYEVVPLALKTTLPFGLHSHPTYLSYLGRLWRLLSMPVTPIEVAALPARRRQPWQSKEDFAGLIQQDIATYLGIPATSWRPHEKKAFLLHHPHHFFSDHSSPSIHSTR